VSVKSLRIRTICCLDVVRRLNQRPTLAAFDAGIGRFGLSHGFALAFERLSMDQHVMSHKLS
jgi:hypothetical protein